MFLNNDSSEQALEQQNIVPFSSKVKNALIKNVFIFINSIQQMRLLQKNKWPEEKCLMNSKRSQFRSLELTK